MVFPKPLFLAPTRFTTCSILGTQMHGFHPLCLAPYGIPLICIFTA